MPTDLREGLARLAERADVAPPPTMLWAHGVRRRNGRRLLSVAVGVAVLVLLVSGIPQLWERVEVQLQPAAAPSTPGIPRALATPSAWTPGTAAAGPLGPLAVIGTAQRHVNWFQAPERVFGVSATTGTYRFLDLPDEAFDFMYGSSKDAALSPDGRHVGYWITGSVPHPVAGEGEPVVGFASYDTTTGRVVRHVVPSSHGLGPNSMMWVSDSVLMVDFGVADEEVGSFSHDQTFLWTPSTDSLVIVAGAGSADAAPPGGYVIEIGSRSGELWRGASPSGVSMRASSCRTPQDQAISPNGELLAVKCYIRPANPLRVGRIHAGVVTTRQVESPKSYYNLLGWADSRHVLLGQLIMPKARSGRTLPDFWWAIVSVDVDTGASRIIGRNPVDATGYASGLWSRGLVDRPRPPRGIDPRWVAGVAAALGLFTVSMVSLARDKRRARDAR